MSAFITFQPVRRLARLMRQPGGMSVARALQAAEERLETVRESCMEGIDANIEALTALVSAEGAGDLATLYHGASEIFAMAGTFQLNELSDAAGSLCDLIDSHIDSGGEISDAPWESARVHVNALRTLRRPELSADQATRRAVLTGLRRLTAQAKEAAAR